MKEKIISSFSNCALNNCLEFKCDENIYIIDTETSKCKILDISEKDKANFHVINPTVKNIFFLASDRCIYTDMDHKKCDFAVFDDKTFCFVEIKDTDDRKQRVKRKSLEQLSTTIGKFKEKIDFEEYEIEAIISWRYRPARPAASTQMQSAKLAFSQNFGARLLEGNQKEFN